MNALLNQGNQGWFNTELFSNSGLNPRPRSKYVPNLANLLISQFALAGSFSNRIYSGIKPSGMLGIFKSRAPFQVLKAVIGRDEIDVIDLRFVFRIGNKSDAHKTMNESVVIFPECDDQISSTPSFRNQEPSHTRFIVIQRKDVSEITNTITRKLLNIFPYFFGHRPNVVSLV